MKKTLVPLTASLFSFVQLAAQGQLRTPVPFAGFEFLNRKSVFTRTDLIEEGTFLFPSQPAPAMVQLKNGRVYPRLSVALNLLDNELLFQDSLGQLYSAVTPVEKIAFEKTDSSANKTVFKTGFPAVEGFTEKTFYQVLAEGRLVLLKAYQVSYTDKFPIDRSVPTRRYDWKELLFVYQPAQNTMRKLSKNKDAVLEVLGDRREQVLAFAAEQKLGFKSEEQLARLFSFYNAQ